MHPRTAYNLFTNANIGRLKEEHPGQGGDRMLLMAGASPCPRDAPCAVLRLQRMVTTGPPKRRPTRRPNRRPPLPCLPAELWRNAPVAEKRRFKLAAEAERQRYREAKEHLMRETQVATAAALAAGADSMAAAKAGMQARGAQELGVCM